MGHQQGGEAALAPQRFDQGLHLDAGQGVKRTQRLVQQQQLRVVHQRPGQGHALPLAPREHRRPFAGALLQADLLQGVQGKRDVLPGQSQRHIGLHPLPGQQARILEHDAHFGFAAGIVFIDHLTAAGRIQLRHQAQQRALAATTATDDGDEFAGGDVQIDVVQHGATAEGLGHGAQLQPHAATGSAAKGLVFLLVVTHALLLMRIHW